jgi:hypothetical protein
MLGYSPDCKDDRMSSVITTITMVFTEWSKQIKNSRKALADNLSMLFTYTRYEYNNFTELIKQRKQFE